MLGEHIDDPLGVEGEPGSSKGLGYLPVTTKLQTSKQLTQDKGMLQLDPQEAVAVSGYQIHVGQTRMTDASHAENACRPFANLENQQPDGAISHDNQVAGTYLHGVFDSPTALQTILKWAGKTITVSHDYNAIQEREIQRLADTCEQHLDWHKIQQILQGKK